MSSQPRGESRRRRIEITRPAVRIKHGTTVVIAMLLTIAASVDAAESNSVAPRWGHASAFIPSPPTLIIQGGKTDPSSSYTYSNSPNTGETLILPLSSGFSTSSPPFTPLNLPSAPTSAWHTLTPLSSSDGTWSLLSFGGDGGTSEAVQTGTDSTWTMDVNPSGPAIVFAQQTAGNGQPMRRIYHSAASDRDGGKTFISGGLKADGSGSTFSEVYSYDSASSTFAPLPNLPVGLYHHTSLLLPNGTLLAMGGAYTSPSTGSATLQPYSTIYSLDTSSTSPSWVERTLAGSLPEGKRGASLVLTDDGQKAFLFGGADASLGQVYGDGWELDLANGGWSQVASTGDGASQRYDHSAVSIGGDQVVIFGGYAEGEAADSNIHIWDSASKSWIINHTRASASSTTSASASSTISGFSKSGSDTATISTGLPETKSGDLSASASGTQTVPSGVVVSSDSATASQTSPPTDAGAHSHPLTTPIRVGLILGILAFVAAVFGLCIWRYKRRQRLARQGDSGSSWPSAGPRGRISSGPFGLQAANSDGLMEKLVQDRPSLKIDHGYWNYREKGASVGLGMGAIGASLASISSKLGARRQNALDPYAEICNEPIREEEQYEDLGGPLRKSSRRVGTGIRLLGPRVQRERSQYYGSSSEPPVRTASIIRDSRIDMLREEDTPQYAISQARRERGPDGEDDWVIPCDESDSKWKSAKSILNARDSGDEHQDQDENPFDGESDYDDDAPILPPVRGGPVPTPHESGTDLGTYDEIASMSNPYSELSRNPYSDLSREPSVHSEQPPLDYQLPSLSPSDPLDLAALLPPPNVGRYSQSSFPTSQRSGHSGLTGRSNAMSDAEEGIIQQAHATHLHSQSPTLVSPGSPESSYEPIKRSESFFRRMAAGGITSLLPIRTASARKKELNIRDPAPQPTLWPIVSRDNLNSIDFSTAPISPSTDDHHPPTSWRRDVLQPPQAAHGKGPSLSSLNSARSMRDMVVVQREATDSSVESVGIIERASSPVDDGTFGQSSRGRNDEANGRQHRDAASPALSQDSAYPDRPSGTGHQRYANGLTIGSETPGEIVFNGAEFASPIKSLRDMDFGPTETPELDFAPILTSIPAHLAASRATSLTQDLKAKARLESDTNAQTGRDNIPEKQRYESEKPSLRPVAPVTPKQTLALSSSLDAGHDKSDTASPAPSASPSPSPYTRRRPVRDVVNSINKRGGATPFTLLSPMSNYSPATGHSGLRKMEGDITGASATGPSNDIVEGNDDPFASPLDITPRKASKESNLSTSSSNTPTPRVGRVNSSRPRPETIHESPTLGSASKSNTSRAPRSGSREGPRDRVISPTPGVRLHFNTGATPSTRKSSMGNNGISGSTRPKTMWEVIKREQGLRVANPDSGKGS